MNKEDLEIALIEDIEDLVFKYIRENKTNSLFDIRTAICIALEHTKQIEKRLLE